MQSDFWLKALAFLKKNKWASFALAALLLVAFYFGALSRPGPTRAPIASPTPVKERPQSGPGAGVFDVVEVSPKTGVPVAPGATEVVVTASRTLSSAGEFSVDVYPKPPSPLKVTGGFPSAQIKLLLPSLLANTNYTITIKDASGVSVYSWIVSVATKEAVDSFDPNGPEYGTLDHDPLFEFIPFYGESFDLDYTGILTLSVVAKKGNQDAVTQEVETWIRSHGMDPSRYRLVFVKSIRTEPQ